MDRGWGLIGPRLCLQDRGKASHPCFLLFSCFRQESDTVNTSQQVPMLSFSWQTSSMFEQHPCQKVLPWISSKSSSLYIVLTTSRPWAEAQLLASLGRVTRRALVYCSVAYGCSLDCLLSIHVHLPLKASEQKPSAHSTPRLREPAKVSLLQPKSPHRLWEVDNNVFHLPGSHQLHTSDSSASC